MLKSVPFYSNTPDDTHCVQAAFRSILKYFLPDRDFSWAELEEMSAKVPDMSTWPAQMLLNLNKMGFEITLMEGFDANQFIKNGEAYLKKEFGQEAAEWQIANSDIKQERRLYQDLLDSDVTYENLVPELSDIKRYLDQDYLVKVTLNSKRLNHKSGYVGHSVVVYDIDEQKLVFHDPGLPAMESRVERLADFEAAWADPNVKAKELIAVRYKG